MSHNRVVYDSMTQNSRGGNTVDLEAGRSKNQ